MTTATAKKRPKHLDLSKIRLPVPGIVSILHRVTGAGLIVVGVPVLLAVLRCTLASQEGFDWWSGVLSNPVAKLLVLALTWAFMHHLFAGLRYLALDLHKGIELQQARFWSKVVLLAGAVATLVMGALIW
jgi:succinate dehydrogenase / fumarate reductase, cytochrome b subunit